MGGDDFQKGEIRQPIRFSKTMYDGQTLNGKKHGWGTCEWPNGNRYSGTFVSGKREGQGVMEYSNGDRYEGQWKANKSEGQGVYEFSTGARYEGQWKANKTTLKSGYPPPLSHQLNRSPLRKPATAIHENVAGRTPDNKQVLSIQPRPIPIANYAFFVC